MSARQRRRGADHFIPRIDAVENLDLAEQRCNNDKRDLAALA